MPKRYRVRPFLTQAHYIAIGRAIATWAALEIKIDEQLLRMLHHQNAALIRARDRLHRWEDVPKGLKRRLILFTELTTAIYEGEPLREFLSVPKRCLTLAKHRHRLAHGEWIIEFLPTKTQLTSQLRKANTPVKPRTFSVQEIRQTTHQICDLYADLLQLMISYPPVPLAEVLKGFFRDLIATQTTSARPPIRDRRA